MDKGKKTWFSRLRSGDWVHFLQSVKLQVRSTFDLRTSVTILTVLSAVSFGIHTVHAKVENSILMYRVYYNGKYIGVVRDLTLITQKAAEWDPNLPAKLTWTEVRQSPPSEWNDWAVAYALEDELQKKHDAVAIEVNGRSVATVADEATAKKVIQDIEGKYADGSSSVTIEQKIDFVPTMATLEQILTETEAVSLLLKGTPQPQKYLVARGDSLWTIAEKNKISVDALKSANPGIENENEITEGQTLDLVTTQPLLTVKTVNDIERTVDIDYDVKYQDDPSLPAGQTKVITEGQEGQKKQWIRQIKRNGTVVKEDVLREETLKEKVDKIIARGTKQTGEADGDWIWPTDSRVITSPYGEWRGNEAHPGVDIGAPFGSPVWATNSGRVIFAGWDNGGYGLCVRIDHGNGIVSIYGHLSAVEVSVGDLVDKGQMIGKVGMTGEATGPHLHYEVHVGGVRVNPGPYM
ncbi:peptidase M23 [Collibacillus ludicampi]|uniref:Peptidase M23 n=1 Tax=Collibacillus ludicampi TaxID=2771369 RepID=A0AAV4LC14_9BACL|nr:peptidoglycan DD-metalloendopeptidase family protein [Collibacillus ludicampi]GIM45336.1 peptidase M23 [Collibacillus ludicampi]